MARCLPRIRHLTPAPPLPVRAVRKAWHLARTAPWGAHSRLFLLGDAQWVIQREVAVLGAIASDIGARVADPALVGYARRQSVYFGNQFTLADPASLRLPHRLAVAYYHGRPGTRGYPEFDHVYDALRANPSRFARIHVTHSELHELVLEAGVPGESIFRIPLGIDLGGFGARTAESRERSRREVGVPEDAFVVGSFQKDGVGWGEGLEPKLIKGPDVLVAALERVRRRVPRLFVLLSGPARGYVRRAFEQRGIAYAHRYVADDDIPRLYEALDAYLISSRQEGGPKALLEAFATGVPVVTTPVGQAMDLARHGENAFVADVEDDEGLAHWLEVVAAGGPTMDALVAGGRETAAAASYTALTPRWREFFDGFVALRR